MCQKCSRCKNMHSLNRNKSRFSCTTCGYKDHSDLNDAKNIRDNYYLSFTYLKSKSEEQASVNKPNESRVKS